MRMKAFLFTFSLALCIFIIGFSVRQDSVPTISGTSPKVKLPAIMYHSILKDPFRTGEYVVTPESFENDLIYLKEHGYTAIFPSQITDFCENGIPLPEKPVLITFDDGHLNNMTYALPLLEKYGMNAVINIVGAFTEQAEKENDPNPYYAYLRRDDILSMKESGRIEFGCHTYNFHSLNGRNGASINKGEAPEHFKKLFREDISKWNDMFSGKYKLETDIFAYPFGFRSDEGDEVLEENGFKIILTCRESCNYLEYSGEKKLIFIDRFNRSGLLTTEEFMAKSGIN